MRRLFACLVLLFSFSTAFAAIDVYEFESPEEEQRFRGILGELRCPKCQNQNLADSNAGIAKDLKDRSYQLMKAGKTDAEITEYMIERYGDFITYRPPLRASTFILWVGPFILLIVVAFAVVWRVRRVPAQTAKPISDAERERLEDMLRRADKES